MVDRPKTDKLKHPEHELATSTKVDLDGGIASRDGRPVQITGTVSLRQADLVITDDAALWAAIRNRTDAIRGERYEEFIKQVLCGTEATGPAACLPDDPKGPRIGTFLKAKRAELIGATSGYGVDAYNLLKYATQAFLLLEAGVVIKLPRFPLNEVERHLTISDIVPDEIKTFLATLVPLP